MSELMHYGVKRRSGRYPWGSGEDPNQHDGSFMGVVDAMRAQGMNDSEIARARGMSRNELQARLKSERLAKYEADKAQLLRLKDKGYSNVAAAERLNISEAKPREDKPRRSFDNNRGGGYGGGNRGGGYNGSGNRGGSNW